MAKLTISVAVFLLLLTVANARLPSNLAAKEAAAAVDEETLTVLPGSSFDSKTTSTNPIKPETESETAATVDWDPETTEAKLTESESSDGATATADDSEGAMTATDNTDGETATADSSEVETMESEKIDSNSVTVIRLHPINRHFARRPFPFPYSRGHRCHQRVHQHRRQFKAEGPRFRGRDTSYGSDVILSEEGVKFERVHRDRPRQFPVRWMKFRNEVPRFKEEETRIHRHSHSHSFGNDETRHQEHEHEQEHENKPTNAFMKKIRKFLTNF